MGPAGRVYVLPYSFDPGRRATTSFIALARSRRTLFQSQTEMGDGFDLDKHARVEQPRESGMS